MPSLHYNCAFLISSFANFDPAHCLDCNEIFTCLGNSKLFPLITGIHSQNYVYLRYALYFTHFILYLSFISPFTIYYTNST